MLTTEDYAEAPAVALPETCEGLQSKSSMNQQDQNEVKRLIAESRKGFPLWAKESLAFTIVMAGAAFLLARYVPALIDSQTKEMAVDIGNLNTRVGNIDESVKRIDSNVRDLLSRAFDGLMQRREAATKKGGAERSSQVIKDLQLVKSVIELAHTAEYHADPDSVSLVGHEALVEAASPTETAEFAWQTALVCVNYRSFLNSGLLHPDVSAAPGCLAGPS